MSIYFDITEFLRNPVRSGIQRVTAQICNVWPGELLPVRFVPGVGLVRVAQEALPLMVRHFQIPQTAALTELSVRAGRDLSRIELRPDDSVFVPELFYDMDRIAFYDGLPGEDRLRLRFLVHDMIPLERPEFFPDVGFEALCAYYRLVRRLPNCGFVSEATQIAYSHRLCRNSQLLGRVFSPGSDAFGPERPAARARRPLNFVVIGRIEPSKNAALIIEAITPFVTDKSGIAVTFLGTIGNIGPTLAAEFRGMAGDPMCRLTHLAEPHDEALKSAIDGARALIFLSNAEGYGLPPVECLWRGTPVISSVHVPSLRPFGSTGIHILDPVQTSTIRDAVSAFVNPDYALAKQTEALSLRLPTWNEFGAQLKAWCQGSE